MTVTADKGGCEVDFRQKKKLQSFSAWTFLPEEFSAAVYMAFKRKNRRFASNPDFSPREDPKEFVSKRGEPLYGSADGRKLN
jgi:hypothetical protein